MRTTLLRTGQLLVALCLSPTVVQAQTAPATTYGPQLEPATFAPQEQKREEQQRNHPFFELKRLAPYEQAVSDWKGRQHSCMKKGSLCFENMPLPSDLLRAPSAR